MVFRGIPSKGCAECRRKKIKCDQSRPACSQCLKYKHNLPCPGYRDNQGLRVMDESNEVARKALSGWRIKPRKPATGLKKSSSSSGAPRRCPDTDELARAFPLNQSSTLPGEHSLNLRPLLPSLESQGIRYFLANYVLGASDLCFGHMQNLLSWKTCQSKTLQVAMGAVGLAGLSNRRGDPNLMAKARNQYAVALGMTTSHLQDPSRCTQDRTFSAVALLGLFEVWLWYQF